MTCFIKYIHNETKSQKSVRSYPQTRLELPLDGPTTHVHPKMKSGKSKPCFIFLKNFKNHVTDKFFFKKKSQKYFFIYVVSCYDDRIPIHMTYGRDIHPHIDDTFRTSKHENLPSMVKTTLD